MGAFQFLALELLLAILPVPQGTEQVVDTWEDGTPRVRREVRRAPDGGEILHGSYATFHANGQPECEGRYDNGLRTGRWTVRWPDGKRREQGRYEKGVRAGPWNFYHEDGSRSAQGAYADGAMDGEWKFWNPGGRLRAEDSGVYQARSFDLSEFGRWGGGDRTARWEGQLLDKTRHGRWTLRRPDGSIAFTGLFRRGKAEGPWVFLLADGTFDEGWISRAFADGTPGEPVTELPADLDLGPHSSPSVGRIPAISIPADVLARLERAAAGDAGARAQLLEDPESAFVHIVERLLRAELLEEAGRLEARGLLEVVDAMNGRPLPWPRETAEDLRRCALRLQSRWELSASDAVFWKVRLDPGLRWGSAPERPGPLDEVPPAEGLLRLTAMPGKYGGRFGGSNQMRAMFGGKETQQPLEAGVAWIRRVQEPAGPWDPGRHGGDARFIVGTTALCLQALAVHGNPVEDVHGASLRGIRWLLQRLDPESGSWPVSVEAGILEHALAAQALCEAASWMPGTDLERAVRAALVRLLDARLTDGSFPARAGSDVGDPLATVHALKAVLLSGEIEMLESSAEVLEKGFAWIDAATGPDGLLPAGATTGLASGTPASATALAVLLDHAASRGRSAGTPAGRRQAWLSGAQPSSQEDAELADPQFVMQASLACFQIGGKTWSEWNERCKQVVLTSQLLSGEHQGAWDPVGSWGSGGGRVAATALRCLTLQTYFRYRKSGGR